MSVNFPELALVTPHPNNFLLISQGGVNKKITIESLFEMIGHTTTTTTTTTSTLSTTSSTLSSTSTFSTTSSLSTTSSTLSTTSSLSTTTTSHSTTTTSHSTTTTSHSSTTTTSSLSTTTTSHSTTTTSHSTTTSSLSTTTTSHSSTTTSHSSTTTTTSHSTTTTSHSTTTTSHTSTTTTTSLSTTTTSHTSTCSSTCSTLSTTTTTHSSSSTTTTTHIPCEYDDDFSDDNAWQVEATHNGNETFTIIANRGRLTLLDEISAIRIAHMYLLPVDGDYDVRIDLATYSANDNTNAPDVLFRLQDGVGANRAEVNYTLNADGTTHELRSGLRKNNSNQFSSIVNPVSIPTALRIKRTGMIITTYYTIGAGWVLIDFRDYESYSCNVREVALVIYSNGANGGYVEFDNLDFLDGCPEGQKAWTTTTTTTTSSSTTTTTSPP